MRKTVGDLRFPVSRCQKRGKNSCVWVPLWSHCPVRCMWLEHCVFVLSGQIKPDRCMPGVPNPGCRHPFGVSDSFPESNTKNSKFGVPQRLSQIRILIDYDQDVSDQLGLTEGYRFRRFETPECMWSQEKNPHERHGVYSCMEVARRSFSTAAPLTWNSLPPAVLNCESLSTFKSRLKTHMFYIAFS